LESECCALLLTIVLHVDVNDRWILQLHASSKYNVTSAYNFLTSRDQPLNNDNTIISPKEVPLKVNIFTWRLIRNRLSTINNLIRRHVLQPNTSFCSCGCGSQEDVDHMSWLATFLIKFGKKYTIGSEQYQPS